MCPSDLNAQPRPEWLGKSTLKCVIALRNSDVPWDSGEGGAGYKSQCLTLCILSQVVIQSVIFYFSFWHDAGVEVEAEPQVDRRFVVVVQKAVDNWLSMFVSLHPSGAASLSNP